MHDLVDLYTLTENNHISIDALFRRLRAEQDLVAGASSGWSAMDILLEATLPVGEEDPSMILSTQEAEV